MRQLELTFSPGTLKHLGGQMYGGGLVRPIAELVANAWDADATDVEITLPTAAAGDVEVVDNGHGMSFEECDELYLSIGANRRQLLGTDRTRSGRRKVMGRKGLGKLAVIQVSGLVEVDTVSAKDPHQDEPWRTHFQIPYGTFLTREDPAEASQVVTMLHDEEAPAGLAFLGSRTGTRTTLHDVRLQRAPSVPQFVESLHVRFAVSAERDDFRVRVNGVEVPTLEAAIEAQEFEFRYDGDIEVPDVGPVRWWIGFTRDPQTRDELQGVGVYVRNRMAVDRPFFFNLTRGFTGQLAKEYMTGAVCTDALDEDDDLIATDRGTINWEHPIGAALEAWGRELIRQKAAQWERDRGRRRLEDLRPDPRLMELIDGLGEKPKSWARTILERLARVSTATKADLDQTATLLLNGYQHQEFRDALDELTGGDVEHLPLLLERWQVLEALLYLPVVKSRVDVLDKLERLIREAAPEFPDIFDALRETPVLLRPEWEPLHWNNWMATIVKEVFERTPLGEAQNQIRPDVLCLSDSRNFVVVELKRPGLVVSRDEVLRMLDYMRRIKAEVEQSDTWRGGRVQGVLICDDMEEDARFLLEGRDDVQVKGWTQFLDEAQRAHKFILERVARRVPAGDPRAMPFLPAASSYPEDAAEGSEPQGPNAPAGEASPSGAGGQ